LAIRFLASLTGFCALAKAFDDFLKHGWHSIVGWEALAVYCVCTAFVSLRSATVALADRKRAEARRAYEVAIVRDGVLAARQAIER
jgi:hypothetical protein